MADLRIDLAAEFRGKKAFTTANKSVVDLEKSVKKLGRTLGLTLSAAAVINFGKKAAQAFIQDEKEATRLATAVKNLGLEFANPAIADYIERLSLASGVSDSQLRPAFQALLTTTGSLTESQELLAQAIDVSAGSGVELSTVAQDLANAYVGNTKGLKKYNLGLTQAELKSSNFADIQAKLNKQFSGANAAYLETYAGKLSLIGTAAGEAQERIGQAVIDLSMAVTGASDVEQLVSKIASATDFAVDRIDNFIEGWRILKAIINSNIKNMGENIQKVQVEEFNRRLKRDYMKAWSGVNIPMTPAQKAAAAKAEAAAAKRAKELAAAQLKQTAELKKQAALKKAGTLFDMEQIQITAALKGNISAEERKRLELQFALLTGNEDQAKKLTYELATAQGLGEQLARFLANLPTAKNPFASWEAYLDMLAAKARGIVLGVGAAPLGTQAAAAASGRAVVNTNVPSTNVGTPFGQAGSFVDSIGTPFGQAGGSAPAVVNNITVQGNLIREQELIDKVLAGAQLSSLSGSPSQIGRISGMFG